MQKNIVIDGMSCGRDANDVADHLRKLNSVYHVAVDFADRTATVDTTGEVTDDALRQAVEESGFKVESMG